MSFSVDEFVKPLQDLIKALDSVPESLKISLNEIIELLERVRVIQAGSSQSWTSHDFVNLQMVLETLVMKLNSQIDWEIKEQVARKREEARKKLLPDQKQFELASRLEIELLARRKEYLELVLKLLKQQQEFLLKMHAALTKSNEPSKQANVSVPTPDGRK